MQSFVNQESQTLGLTGDKTFILYLKFVDAAFMVPVQRNLVLLPVFHVT